MNALKELILTFFYTGYSPWASGTAGTAGAFVLALLILPTVHFGAACAVIVAATLLIGIPLGKWAEARWGKKDPGPFVLDEVAGYFVTLFRIDAPKPEVAELVVAFFAFRFFDVIKPPPARRIEGLHGGLGIMLDDIVAGLYALAVVFAYRFWVLDMPF